jgi:hypothetical protein
MSRDHQKIQHGAVSNKRLNKCKIYVLYDSDSEKSRRQKNQYHRAIRQKRAENRTRQEDGIKSGR